MKMESDVFKLIIGLILCLLTAFTFWVKLK